MRDNWHAALIASLIANTNRAPNTRPIEMHKFLYRDSDTEREEKDAEMIALLDAWKAGNPHG